MRVDTLCRSSVYHVHHVGVACVALSQEIYDASPRFVAVVVRRHLVQREIADAGNELPK